MIANQKLRKGNLLARCFFPETDQEGKRSRRNGTPHVTALFKYLVDLSFSQQKKICLDGGTPGAEQKTNFAYS